MLEVVLIFGVMLLILTFFYKQAVCEFRINQLEWAQKDQVRPLLEESIPLVIRGIPPLTCWSRSDVEARDDYAALSLFQEMNLVEWIQSATEESGCPWLFKQAEQIAAVSGLSVWASKTIHPVILSRFRKAWWYPRYHCWAGKMGLQRTYAVWTCILPVDGEIIVSIMPETVESALPANWAGCVPSELTAKDTPFLADVKFMDIVLRPGTALMMPAHWFVSWVSKPVESKPAVPMVCTISYHSPISHMAFMASPFTK